MEVDLIKNSVRNIPYSEYTFVREAHEVWEVDDGDAHVIVSRHTPLDLNGLSLLTLSVSGSSEERRRVVEEFSQIYGKPEVPVDHEDYQDTVSWIYPKYL